MKTTISEKNNLLGIHIGNLANAGNAFAGNNYKLYRSNIKDISRLSFLGICLLFILVFILAFLYLHQKISIYVEAYRLSKNLYVYNELVDNRDYLVYNFKKEVSLSKINQWAEGHNFIPVAKEKVLALRLNKDKEKPAVKTQLASIINRFLRVPAATSTVLADDKE
ncbi:MAG: hypothetical protein ABH872_01610 [Candidatus Omnitrophota bacterium]